MIHILRSRNTRTEIFRPWPGVSLLATPPGLFSCPQKREVGPGRAASLCAGRAWWLRYTRCGAAPLPIHGPDYQGWGLLPYTCVVPGLFSSFQECEDAPQRAAEEYARSVRGSVPPTPTLYMGDRRSSRKRARVIGNDEAPGLFTEGSYRYSVLSSSLDVSNHHPNLLLARGSSFASEIA